MRVIKGLRVIEVPLLSNAGCSTHHLFIKEHTSSDNQSETGTGRTLFVGNIDYGIIKGNDQMSYVEVDKYLREIFETFGTIDSISVSKFKGSSGSDDTTAAANASNEVDDSNIHEYIEGVSHKISSISSSSNNSSSSEKYTRFAHIVFKKKKVVHTILSSSDRVYHDITHRFVNTWGLNVRNGGFNINQKTPMKCEHIAALYSYITTNSDELQQEVDIYMKDFDEKEEIEKNDREKRSKLIDEDGFMPVQHRRKKKRAMSEKRTSMKSRSRGGEDKKKKQRPTELKNFYRHQIREKKREKLEELREKFEEDKQKVASMKMQRKFKPF